MLDADPLSRTCASVSHVYVPLTRLELQTDDWTDTDDEPARAAQNDANAHLDATLSLPVSPRRIGRSGCSRSASRMPSTRSMITKRSFGPSSRPPALAELEDDNPLEIPKRDDDMHYFESYCGTGASTQRIDDGA